MALPSNSSGGEEIGLAAIGTAASLGGFCGWGTDVGAVATVRGIVVAVFAGAFARVGDRGGTAGAVVAVVDLGTGVLEDDDNGAG